MRLVFSIICLVLIGCVPRLGMNPLVGWHAKGTAFESQPFGTEITADYRHYIQALPRSEGKYALDYNIMFFENSDGRRAVEISIPLEGTWWKHVLIYDADNNRSKIIKYASRRYRS